MNKSHLKSYLVRKNPKVLTICSSSDERSDFNLAKKQKGSPEFQKILDSENNVVLSVGKYRFPHMFPKNLRLGDFLFVCFMGCNQLHMLFTRMFATTKFEMLEEDALKEHIHEHLDVARRNFPSAYFVFAERVQSKVHVVPFRHLAKKYNRTPPSNIDPESWSYRLFVTQTILDILDERLGVSIVNDTVFYKILPNSNAQALENELKSLKL